MNNKKNIIADFTSFLLLERKLKNLIAAAWTIEDKQEQLSNFDLYDQLINSIDSLMTEYADTYESNNYSEFYENKVNY